MIDSFVSVVILLKNDENNIESTIKSLIAHFEIIASDFEIIIVDNASTDNSVQLLQALSIKPTYPNLQVYALTKEVDSITGYWVGIENSIGDYVLIINPYLDDVSVSKQMLMCAINGHEIVFAKNKQNHEQSKAYEITSKIFNAAYRLFTGFNLAQDAPKFRLLSRRVVNYLMLHTNPAISYLHLPAKRGFSTATIEYNYKTYTVPAKIIKNKVNIGVKLLVSATSAPMRLITTITMFSAAANLAYSIYVILISILKSEIAPGWTSLSLQQSGMFFLISLALLVIGEYILHATSLSEKAPQYHIGQEFSSSRIIHREKLNIYQKHQSTDHSAHAKISEEL